MGLEFYTPRRQFAEAWSKPNVQDLVHQLNNVYRYTVPTDGYSVFDRGGFQDFADLDLYVKNCPTCSQAADVPLLYDRDCYSICNRAGCSDHLTSDRADIVNLMFRINEEIKKNLNITDASEE